MKMALERKRILGVVADLTCIFVVGLPVLLLGLIGEPFKRGFFCNDETIRHPYKDSSIPTSLLILVSVLAPCSIFVIVELALGKSKGNKGIARLTGSVYNILITFIFGMAVNQLITDVCKYSIGRLRPHFLDACNPDIELNEENCGTPLQPIYITDFACLGSENFTAAEKDRKIKDARLSFLSGHASLSTFSMVFTIIYLQTRLTGRSCRLVKPVMQVLCIIFSFYTTLSRISDYKHHPEDIIAGALLGLVMAFITHILATERFGNRSCVNTATSTTTLMTMPSSYTKEFDQVTKQADP